MAGAKSFGGRSRIVSPSGGGPIGQTFVNIIGNVLDTGPGPEAFAGILSCQADEIAVPPSADKDYLAVAGLIYGVNFAGDAITRLRQAGDDSDAEAVSPRGALLELARNYGFNGTTWDRIRSAAAAILAAQSSVGAQLIAAPGQWSVTHSPAVNTVATITKAAGAAGVRHVCTSLLGALSAPGAAATPVLNLRLRDGVSGAGTILWSATHMAGIGFADEVSQTGLNIVGSAATAMTLEFDIAPGANNFASVALTGYDAS